MTLQRKDELDSFGRDVQNAADVDLGLECVTTELAAVAPPSDFRARLLSAARPEDRLARYAAPVAALLDIDVAAAQALVGRIDDPTAWIEFMPGIWLLPAPAGPLAAGSLRGFVRVRAGVEFPEHSHLGDEAVMIMQGYYADSVTGQVFGPGETPRQAIDTQHSFRVLADGPDLLGLVVAFGGLRAQGQEFLPF